MYIDIFPIFSCVHKMSFIYIFILNLLYILNDNKKVKLT